MIVVTGTAPLKDGARDAFVAASRPMIAASRDQPGCTGYSYAFDLEDPNTVVFFEAYEDEDALNAHFQSPHLAAFIGATMELMAGRPRMTKWVDATPAALG